MNMAYPDPGLEAELAYRREQLVASGRSARAPRDGRNRRFPRHLRRAH